MCNKKTENLIYMIMDSLECVPTVKLAKLMYYCDFEHYAEHRKSITNSKYLHLAFGPCPADFEETIAHLKRINTVGVEERMYNKVRTYKVYKAEVKPDLTVFTHKELETINGVIKRYGKMAGEKLAQKTHGELPWKATKAYDEIPYAFALYMYDEPLGEEPEDKFLANNPLLHEVVRIMKKKIASGETKKWKVVN